MKSELITLFAAAMLIVLSGCSTHEPDPGVEVVFIMKPYIFGAGGVVMNECKGTGLYYTMPSTSGAMVNIKPYQREEGFDDLITQDNNPVDFQVFITMRVKPGNSEIGECYSPVLVRDFGSKWYENKVQQPMRNFVRDYTKGRKMFAMTTDPTVTDLLSKSLLEYAQDFVETEKIPVEIMKITVGRVVPPSEVLAETIATAKEKQRKKTMGEKKLAEDARLAAETSKAAADGAYMAAMKMTPEAYVKLREVENQTILYNMIGDEKIGKRFNIYLGTMPQPVISQ